MKRKSTKKENIKDLKKESAYTEIQCGLAIE